MFLGGGGVAFLTLQVVSQGGANLAFYVINHTGGGAPRL